MADIAARTETNEGPAARLGAELRAARRSLGWELPQLAGSLRIRQSYLEAIETGCIADLPGTTYALGFVRAYATALGLPGEEMARRFRAEAEGVNVKPTLRFPAPVPRRGVPAGALMLLGLVILAGSYGGWYWITEHRATPVETVPPIPDRLATGSQKTTPSPLVASLLPNTAPPATLPPLTPQPKEAAPVPPGAAPQTPANEAAVPQAESVPPASAPAMPQAAAPQLSEQAAPQPAVVQAPAPEHTDTAAPPPPSAASTAPPPPEAARPAAARIVVKATADAWLTVKQPVGPPVLNKMMHAGDSWPVPPDAAGLMLTTGNAGATTIEVDGSPIPQSLGTSGMVRRDVPLNADLLKSGHLPPPKPRTKLAVAQ